MRTEVIPSRKLGQRRGGRKHRCPEEELAEADVFGYGIAASLQEHAGCQGRSAAAPKTNAT
ncbi:hypothetical protein QP162_22530 [Sphingomonas aurantiaca]